MIRHYEAVTAEHIVEKAADKGLPLHHALPAHRQLIAPGMRAAPLPVVHSLWEAAVRELGDPCFPLRCVPPLDQARSIVAMAGMVSPDMRQAMQRVARYWPLVTDAFGWSIVAAGDRVVVSTEVPRNPPLGWCCSIEFHLADLLHAARRLTGGHFRPLEVRFAHEPPLRVVRAFEETLGARVRTGWGRVELLVESAQMDLPLEPVPGALAGLVLSLAEESLVQLARPPSFVERVRRLLDDEPIDPGIDLARAAKRLGVSTRTLHRRLRDHGTSYQDLLDEARRRRAELLLAEPTRSSEEIAEALGLSRRGFFRAFRRWTGDTPTAFRRRWLKTTT